MKDVTKNIIEKLRSDKRKAGNSFSNKGSSKDKRKDKRENYLSQTEIKKDKTKILCATVNLSEGGVGIISDQLIPPGDCVVEIDNQKIKAKIVYRKTHNKGMFVESSIYQYGIRFHEKLKPEIKNLCLAKAVIRLESGSNT